MSDTADGVLREGDDFVLAQKAGVAALDAEHLPSAVDRGEHGCSDHGIQPGSITAPGG
jgi:hypothetical protein